MGITSRETRVDTAQSSIADVLFTPVQQRVLALLFGQPDRKFQSSELIRLANSGTGAVHRFLTRMGDMGLVIVEKIGNQKYYRANPQSPVFEELAGLVRKTVGLVAPLRGALGPLEDRIVAAFVYGSVAKGGASTASQTVLHRAMRRSRNCSSLVARMTSAELENLARIGHLKLEPPSARERRNLAEYEGYLEHDERLLAALIEAASKLREQIRTLPTIGDFRPRLSRPTPA